LRKWYLFSPKCLQTSSEWKYRHQCKQQLQQRWRSRTLEKHLEGKCSSKSQSVLLETSNRFPYSTWESQPTNSKLSTNMPHLWFGQWNWVSCSSGVHTSKSTSKGDYKSVVSSYWPCHEIYKQGLDVCLCLIAWMRIWRQKSCSCGGVLGTTQMIVYLARGVLDSHTLWTSWKTTIPSDP
jgi:hypothetical protein